MITRSPGKGWSFRIEVNPKPREMEVSIWALVVWCTVNPFAALHDTIQGSGLQGFCCRP